MAKKEERKKVLEREYVIHMRKEISKVPSYKRAEKAITAIKEFLLRHMKVYDRDKKKIKLSKWLNEAVWARSIKNPPVRIKVKAVKFSDGIVEAELAELSKNAQIEKTKEQQRKEEAEKIDSQKAEEAKKAEEVAKPEEKEQEEAKKEEKERTDELKKEEILLEKEVQKQQKDIIKQKKEVHKKTMMGI